MKRKIVGYAIHYCDYGGLDVAYTFDADVPGGISLRDEREPVALFADRKAARKAIRISELAARLAVERGENANTDFIDPKCRKNIRIVPVEAAS